jgi:2-polyprenyl-6-hydroxyphenyl methylase/3-demethylubiquinone-9 3-methyltransferase
MGVNNTAPVNNRFYEDLGERWYQDDRHPIALLRAETRARLAYIEQVLGAQAPQGAKVLDLGCGGGFITIPLACRGYDIRGIDISANALAVAQKHLPEGKKISFRQGDVCHLRETAGTYDAVLMMDILEHLEDREAAIGEASRMLKPDGLFLFHTFNRNVLSYLLAVKGVEVLCANPPDNIHVYRLFIKPSELARMCARAGIGIREFVGVRPRFLTKAFWSSVFTRRVHPEFDFELTSSLIVGYLGYGVKQEPHGDPDTGNSLVFQEKTANAIADGSVED